MKKFYAILCIAIASLTQLQAQAPQGFNYQATVRNSAGDLIVNTNVYFKFNVMQGSQTSLPVFTEIHYVPTDDLGQVNLVIGQGTATTGTFSSIDWSLGSYYLGIELDTGSGYVAMGTTQLLSVPYALYAENSGNSTPTTPNLETVLAENNSANNQQIKDLQDPTDAQDAVTKAYADALSSTQGLMNFNGWDNYQVWQDNSTITLTPNSFVFINANNTTLVFPDGPENCCFGDVIYVYVMDGDPLTTMSFNLQANGSPVAVGGGDEELVWTSSEIIVGEFNSVGLKTVINVGDYWMVADFRGFISNNLTAQVNPIDDIYVCSGDDAYAEVSTTNTQGTTQYYWTNDNDSTGIPLSGIGYQGVLGHGVFNNTSEPQVSTITVTPELTFQGQTTTGPSETFTVTVNPSGQVNQVDDITVFSGETTQPIVFSTSNTSGTTTYIWTNDNPSLGISTSGGFMIDNFTAINNSVTPIVGTITVTPTFSNGGVSCDGPSISFTITVNPTEGSVTDQNGNTYNYLSYGDQVWTVENAEMVTYRDGTPIPQVSSGESIDIQALNNDLGGTQSDWGLVGYATVNGWSGPDMEMYQTSSGVFELYASLLGNSLKFRYNEDWGQSYGDTGADGTLEAEGDNIAVPGDGIYHVVLNLNSLTYSLTEVLSWPNLTTGAWCYYDNDPTKGKLYNWYAVMGIHDTDPNTPNKEFAPEGWHVPSDAEWTTLENYLIANGYNYDGTTTGNKIAKAMASTTGWVGSTQMGAVGNDQSLNNSSGFNAFPEGIRYGDGSFYFEGYSAFFWSSTETSTYNAWIRGLYNSSGDLFRDGNDKQGGFSVRFVRD